MGAESLYIYKILSLGLTYPDKSNFDLMDEILQRVADIFESELGDAVLDFRDKFNAAKGEINELQSEYLRTFDVGALVTPYETEYLTEKISRKPHELADIAGFYEAFGVHVNDQLAGREALDHISVEFEFMAILLMKQEYAQSKGLEEQLFIVREAKENFFKEHISRWIFKYLRLLDNASVCEYYVSALNLLNRLMEAECIEYGLDAASLKTETNTAFHNVVEEDFTCGCMADSKE
ncbi:MAG: molecular chaperone TorD family protein [Nitrospirae bacterium]|nr:molecular chaperone TorD family protein [Nitrospirota bacterium]